MEELLTETIDDIHLNTISNNELPENIATGSIVHFQDTITGNTEDFSAMIYFELAKKYPDASYEELKEKITQSEFFNPIVELLKKRSYRSYTVRDITYYENTDSDTNGSNSNFQEPTFQAERFSHLPNNGIFKVEKDEFAETKTFYIGGGEESDANSNLNSTNIYGYANTNPTYISTDFEVAASHMEDENPILIEIDSDKLLKLRDVYRDPESLTIEEESGKTFVVANGIPKEAIKRIIKLEQVSLPAKTLN